MLGRDTSRSFGLTRTNTNTEGGAVSLGELWLLGPLVPEVNALLCCWLHVFGNFFRCRGLSDPFNSQVSSKHCYPRSLLRIPSESGDGGVPKDLRPRIPDAPAIHGSLPAVIAATGCIFQQSVGGPQGVPLGASLQEGPGRPGFKNSSAPPTGTDAPVANQQAPKPGAKLRTLRKVLVMTGERRPVQSSRIQHSSHHPPSTLHHPVNQCLVSVSGSSSGSLILDTFHPGFTLPLRSAFPYLSLSFSLSLFSLVSPSSITLSSSIHHHP